MSNARQILALLESRASGDEEGFFAIALQIAAAEARQGRRTNAEALRAAVEKARRADADAASEIRLGAVEGEMADLLEHRTPRFRMKDVVLGEELNAQLQGFLSQQTKRDWLREHGRRPNRRLLFVGPPGSGKTITAEALASALRLNLYVVRLEGLVTKYLGETGAHLRSLFDEAAKRRGVFFFDEFDALGGRRDRPNDVGEMRRVLNGFLQAIEEDHSTDSPIIAATNHPELLDEALLRRFDLVL
ncbi:MAG: ATP-binding protein, partial [Parvularcula sp.]|nr:ATP-binding protein [Parvularcula sp.]